MCQGCVGDGYLSQETFDKIEAFLGVWPEAESGPGHVVLADDNVEDVFIQDCLSEGTWSWMSEGHAADELDATRAFLQELLTIPERVR